MAQPSAQFMTDLKVNMTPDTIEFRTSSTVNSYGERTFTGAAVSYDAYIRRANEAERDMDETKIIEKPFGRIPIETRAMKINKEKELIDRLKKKLNSKMPSGWTMENGVFARYDVIGIKNFKI